MTVSPSFKALIVASRAKDHLRMSASAEPFFARMAAENHFSVDFTDDAETIHEENLEQYQVFVMLHLAPFDMTYSQQEALQKFVESGAGVGLVDIGDRTGDRRQLQRTPERDCCRELLDRQSLF